MKIIPKYHKKYHKILIIGVMAGLILSSFSFAQHISPPQTLEEAKEIGKEVGQEIKLNLFGVFKKIWIEEALPVFQKIWNFIKKIWNSYIWPTIKKLWQKITTPFKKEIERRKPIIEEEFEKEKQEIKEEVPKVGKNLWERFKELIR